MNIQISFPMLGDWTICPTTGFTLFGLHVYWYGMILACAFLLAAAYALKMRGRFGITEDDLINLLICVVPGAIIGGRLFYVAFNFDLYRENPITALYVWKGGIAMYGVLAGGILGAWIYCAVKKIRLRAFLDLAAPALLMAQGIGRWANFINREAYGMPTELPWRMGLTNALGITTYVHPLFFYESVWDLLGFWLLHRFVKKNKRAYDGQLFILYLVWYGFGRGLLELLRVDTLYIGDTGVRVAHPIAMACFILGSAVLLVIRRLFVTEPEDLWVNKTAAGAMSDGNRADAPGLADGSAPEAPEEVNEVNQVNQEETIIDQLP